MPNYMLIHHVLTANAHKKQICMCVLNAVNHLSFTVTFFTFSQLHGHVDLLQQTLITLYMQNFDRKYSNSAEFMMSFPIHTVIVH